jgi:hypothetical protein
MTRSGTPIAAAALAVALVVGSAPTRVIAQQKTSPETASSAYARMKRPMAQGFSVVLVVGDLQGSGGEEDVPPAARRALADMKDFLPYKSYKLVDAAWIMGTTHAVSRLRGPEDREYELEINVSDGRLARTVTGGVTTAASESRIGVSFSLRETGGERGATPSAGSRPDDQSLQALAAQLEVLRNQLRDARAHGSASHPEVVRLEHEIAALQAKTQETQRGTEQRRSMTMARAGGRAVINTSFSMDLGETVVVGTSRLSGNSKALIALLTAVPEKSSRR